MDIPLYNAASFWHEHHHQHSYQPPYSETLNSEAY